MDFDVEDKSINYMRKGMDGSIGQRRTAVDLAYDRLKISIIDGHVLPGERLREQHIAEALSISRTPLRHALQRLEAEGWVVRSPTGGLRVVGVSLQEIEALYSVRKALEVIVIQDVSSRLTDDDLEMIRIVLEEEDRVVKANNSEDFIDKGEVFHQTLCEISGNRVCAEFLETIRERTKRYRRLSFKEKSRYEAGNREHWLVYQALKSGENEEATRLLVAHIESSYEWVRGLFEQSKHNDKQKA